MKCEDGSPAFSGICAFSVFCGVIRLLRPHQSPVFLSLGCGLTERAGLECATWVCCMEGSQRVIRRREGTEKDRGASSRCRTKWGVEFISRQRLALALSLVFGTFGTLFDASSWKEKSGEPHALGLSSAVLGN